ncbi:hypothetical protein GQ600_765 [Phytophthora cactorum]|nr:hypothetical protein GQ600_765 [Phytophthora cactorum]
MGHPADQQCLFYKGKRLELKVRASWRRRPHTPHKVFADVTDNSNLHEHNLSSTAPKWRICDEGLNIEGERPNRSVQHSERWSFCRNDFDLFNLMCDTGNDVRCPLWRSLQANNLRVLRVWKFEGVRSSDGFLCSPWLEIIPSL